MSAACTYKPGTHAGWSEHTRKGEKCCTACSEFRRLYMRDRRRALGRQRQFTFPTEVVPGTADIDALGISIARALRESA